MARIFYLEECHGLVRVKIQAGGIAMLRSPNPDREPGRRVNAIAGAQYDFGTDRRQRNLPALRRIGFDINRPILEVEKLTHDCSGGGPGS